jgi:hypothetical protein
MLRKKANDALQPLRLARLRDPASERRFAELRVRYADAAAALATGDQARTDGGSAYAWSIWEREILEAFRDGVPERFLAHPRLRNTMVLEGASRVARRVEVVLAAFGQERGRDLLREDAVGRPHVAESTYLTSANRAHHACHLASYRLRTGRDPWSCSSVLEWGGGYGNMARLFRRLAPGITYTIVDLAPLLALQWVYLASLEGEDACHLVTAAAPRLVPGKVNFVESALVTGGGVAPTAELFLSTWAATESPPQAQAFIAERHFFGAVRLLLAYLRDASNRLVGAAADAGCDRTPVAVLEAEGFAGHEYAFR